MIKSKDVWDTVLGRFSTRAAASTISEAQLKTFKGNEAAKII